ncbi:MAG TPA: hypothetical protein VHF88_05510 [Thermoleophilaceae bacterium]|nr:hypothetical protein [Thermoleophilaceae bacterium]
MRRLTLMTTMAVLTLAVAAGSAMAQTLRPPEPPHPAMAADWKAVNAVDWSSTPSKRYLCGHPDAVCEFSDNAVLTTSFTGFGIHTIGSCSATLSGDVSSDGDVTITGVTPTDCGLGTVDPAKLPATGEICMHKPTQELWVRQHLTNDGPPLYAQVLVQPSGLATDRPTFFARGIMIGNPSVPTFATHTYAAGSAGPSFNNFKHAAFDAMWATSGLNAHKLLLGQNVEQPACGWAELS